MPVLPNTTMWTNYFEPGSSPVDWCENNYIITPNIAEFINTISNILFLLGPPLLIYLFKDYGKHVHKAIHMVWVLLIVVGLSSAYFHATLSLMGQLLDELAILWVFMATMSVFCPKRYLPRVFNKDRKSFRNTLFLLTIAATILSVWHPFVNAFALMLLSIPAVYMIYQEMQRTKDIRVYNLAVRSTTVLAVAIFCWINDRIFCDAWSAINFPYLHGVWHILIFIAAYTACVLFSYFFVSDEKPEKGPMLKFWPNNNWELGIPYVTIKLMNGKDEI